MKVFETSGQLRYIDGFKYQCVEDFWIILEIKGYSVNWKNLLVLEPSGKFHIKFGFGCDGPSGLTIDTDSAMRTAFVHDGIYRLTKNGLLPIRFREYADDTLRDLGIFDNMWPLRARIWHWAVKNFGFGSARRQEAKERLAP